MDDKNVKKDFDKTMEEMSIEELDQLSGGSISNAKKEKRKDLDESVSDRA